jgi:asparagine synthase (glutamine-hydrolysing)
MCAIAGIISYNTAVPASALQQMAGTLQHRGPNGEGYWISTSNHIGFAHRRLAIIDLSEAAAQPLHYLHYTIVYNGEIYNYKELRQQLQSHGYHFTSNGDTEIIPAAFDLWGMDCLQRFDGMFAFALHNKKTNIVILARDRFGEKPLYYSFTSRHFTETHISGFKNNEQAKGILFASEMKALWAAGVDKVVNNEMLLAYLTLGYVQLPDNKQVTFYKDIFSLPPSHVLQINVDDRKINLFKWYDAEEAINRSKAVGINKKDAVEQFRFLLMESISRRLRSDVPVGTSLSGGIDSSAIVAVINKLTQQHTSANFSATCFTASFSGFNKDETPYATLVADSFKLKQYFVSPTAADLADSWQQLMYYQEEPVQSSSAFTQFLVYKLAKAHNITVLLDGQGADETLAGYKKYGHWYLQQLLVTDTPAFIKERRLLKKNNFLEQWNIKNYAAALSPSFTAKMLTQKARKQYQHHAYVNDEFYTAYANESVCDKPQVKKLEDILYYNSFVFGLEELLRYADRNSMAHSREVRLPFLSHELVEFVFSLPSNFKIRNGFTKWILRNSMQDILPQEIAWRKDKIGYEPPQQQWMQSSSMLDLTMHARSELVKQNILVPSVTDEPMQQKEAHAANNYDWRYLNAAALFNP